MWLLSSFLNNHQSFLSFITMAVILKWFLPFPSPNPLLIEEQCGWILLQWFIQTDFSGCAKWHWSITLRHTSAGKWEEVLHVVFVNKCAWHFFSGGTWVAIQRLHPHPAFKMLMMRGHEDGKSCCKPHRGVSIIHRCSSVLFVLNEQCCCL